MRLWAIALLVLTGVAAESCGEPVVSPQPVYLRIAGPESTGAMVAELTTVFRELHPNVEFEITDQSPEYALEALQTGDADLAVLSWLPSELSSDTSLLIPHPPVGIEARGEDTLGSDPAHAWRPTRVARDGIAIVVHPQNPVAGLGLLQLRDLFAGRIYDWQALGDGLGGMVQPVSREEGSGARFGFEALVMDGSPVTPRAMVVSSAQGVLGYIAGHPEAIGYLSMSWLSPAAKVLKIEGELPTSAAVSRGTYPLIQDVWLVSAAVPSDDVKAFVDFAVSQAGQQIVEEHHGRIR